MLGQGDLCGHQEEDISLKGYYCLLLGLLGHVLGPGLSVEVKGGAGTLLPLADGEPADQLEEVLTAGREPALGPPPRASGRGIRSPPPGATVALCPHMPTAWLSVCLPLLPSGTALGPTPYSLPEGLLVLVDGWHVNGGKDVAVHVVGTSDVVNVGHVGEQVCGVIREEVSIDDGEEAQVVHRGVCVESGRYSHPPEPCLSLGQGGAFVLPLIETGGLSPPLGQWTG